jgi:hypothetical protein
MRGEPVELACPFCDKGKIQCWYIAGVWGQKMKRTKTLPGGGYYILVRDERGFGHKYYNKKFATLEKAKKWKNKKHSGLGAWNKISRNKKYVQFKTGKIVDTPEEEKAYLNEDQK